MTAAQQKRFYFPLWKDVCQFQDWIKVDGRLLGKRPPRLVPGPGRTEYDQLLEKVWDAAEILAQQHNRAVTADDLRHACHVVALGKDYSSHELNTGQLNRVAVLFKILRNPDDIDAMMAWSDPSRDRRKNLVYTINKLAGGADAYVCELAKMFPAFQWPFWEDLPIENLSALCKLMRTRAQQHGGTINPSSPATEDTIPEQKPIDLSQLRKSTLA